MGLHDASLPSAGVTLSVLPFGTSQAPFFDGALKSVLTIPDDQQYSQPFAKALTVAPTIARASLAVATQPGGSTSGTYEPPRQYTRREVNAHNSRRVARMKKERKPSEPKLPPAHYDAGPDPFGAD